MIFLTTLLVAISLANPSWAFKLSIDSGLNPTKAPSVAKPTLAQLPNISHPSDNFDKSVNSTDHQNVTMDSPTFFEKAGQLSRTALHRVKAGILTVVDYVQAMASVWQILNYEATSAVNNSSTVVPQDIGGQMSNKTVGTSSIA